MTACLAPFCTASRLLVLSLVLCFAFAVLGFTVPPASVVSSSFSLGRQKTTAFQLHEKLQQQKYDDEAMTADNDILSLEREVLASTRARLDLQRVTSLLEHNDDVTSTLEEDDDSYYSPWKVALTAGGVAAGLTLGIGHSWTVAVVMWIAVFFIANGDPLDEDSVAGSLARVVGRATLKSVEASQPKVRAVARAAVRGEEDYLVLHRRVQQLEDENATLRLWKQRRLLVDDALPTYTLDELKDLARQQGLNVGGTKSQLLMRLVEAGAIELQQKS